MESQTTDKLKGAVRLTALDLNNIRLDVRHTILTPDYLENLSKAKVE